MAPYESLWMPENPMKMSKKSNSYGHTMAPYELLWVSKNPKKLKKLVFWMFLEGTYGVALRAHTAVAH